MKILIIVPARNEAQNILNTIQDIKNNAPSVDYVVINDESHDDTKEILSKNNISYLNSPVNLGIGGAVQLGYMYAFEKGYDIAIQFDGDGQHDARYINQMIEPIENKQADIVIGSRYIENKGFQSTILRRTGKNFLSLLIKLCCGYKPTDPTSGYRAVDQEWIKRYADDYPADYPEPEALIYAKLNGATIMEIPVEMRERQGGISSINLPRSVYYMIKVSLAIILCRWRIKKVQ